MVSESTGGKGFFRGGVKASRKKTAFTGDLTIKSSLVCPQPTPCCVFSLCPPALHWWRRILPRGQSSAVWGFLLLWLERIRSSPGLQLQPGDHWGSCAPVLPLRAVVWDRKPAPKPRPSEMEKWNANKEGKGINYITLCTLWLSVSFNSFYKLKPGVMFYNNTL